MVEVAQPREVKAQPKGEAKVERDVRRTVKIITEVWMKIGIEKLDSYEGITVKALLDSGATGLFADRKFMEKHGFKMQKLDRPVNVKNVDGMKNSRGMIIHEIEVNIFFKGHVERVRMDVCNLGRTEVILGMPWLAAHNPEINWKTGEVKITRCPPLCGKKVEIARGRGKRIQRNKLKRTDKRDKDDWEWSMKDKFNDEEVLDMEKVEKMVPRWFHRWLKTFGKIASKRMPVQKPWDHAINLKEDFVPKKGRAYLLSRNEKEKVREFVEEQLRKGYIHLLKLPQTSPVFFIGKKNGKKRMVQDYRYLNKGTIKDNYPLPLISDLIDTMGTKKVFTKMDLRWGYNNVRIKEEDEWKIVFTTHLGVYEPVVMYFGLTNSPATFQAMMNDTLRNLIDKRDIAMFIDDVIVGTETEEGHDEIVEEVLKWMEDHDLYLKPEKCVWKVKEVGFLGLVIGKDGIKMEEEKVKEVLDWLRPKYVKDIQKFLGLANYYRRFVKNFAIIAKPLHWLVKKNEKWNWGEKQENAFQALKKVFMTKPILVALDLDKEMRVEADASEYAIGGVLSMRCEDNKWRPIGFISKSFNKTERNYEIHDWEMLAIVRSLEEWRHLLEGAQNKFKIWSDHKNLEYFIGSQKLNQRQARWALYLSRFDFTLKHMLGSSMGRVDSLSQRLDWQVEVEKDNKDRVLIKKE